MFFNNETDAGIRFDFGRDYYCHEAKQKRAKRVAIRVKFDLPNTFKFRSGLEPAEKYLGRSFTIRKLWSQKSIAPMYYLNDSDEQLNQEKQSYVEQFLSLITFRYIPNRVMPLDIIRNEHKALRDVLIKRVAKKAAKQAEVFQTIRDTSASLIGTLNKSVHKACPDVGSIRLATPTSWQDLIFAFGYKLTVRESEIDDVAQGSGIQSLLMFETLSLIDRDYFQKFGWRQAAIWAVEEPESSLHSSLEAEVANYLTTLADNHENRLQIFCTTHSSLMLQYADQSYFVNMSDGQSVLMPGDKKTALEKASKLGISSWTHPILHYPLNPIIMVEGKHDYAFIGQALKIIAPHKNFRVSYLELLQGGNVTGGVEELLKYVKANIHAIKIRLKEAPLIVLLDWDAKGKKGEFEKLFGDSPCKVLVWPDSAFNPKLGNGFRGIERHLPDRIIDEADKKINVLGIKNDGNKTINADDYGKLKNEVFDIIVKQGITDADLVHAKPFLQDLIKLIP